MPLERIFKTRAILSNSFVSQKLKTKLIFSMYEFSKQILEKVSFDKFLFKKELQKAIKSLKDDEIHLLKEWCIATFGNHRDMITEVFQTIGFPSQKAYEKENT